MGNWIKTYSIFSLLNFITFTLTVVYGRTNLHFLIPFLIINAFFCFWEALKIYKLKFDYFKAVSNRIDTLMLFVLIYWIVSGYSDIDSPFEEYVLAFFVTWRGINSFRIFDGTRYYFRLVKESLDSIKYFLIILAYSTIFFSILLFVLGNKHQTSFIDVWKKSWDLNFSGQYEEDYSASDVLTYFTVVGATILNVILMLNLLISILGDKYDLFMVEKNVYDMKEKIDFSLEIQKTLFWKRQYNQSKYFYIVKKAFSNDDEDQSSDWQGKIIFLEKRQEKKLEDLNKTSKELKRIVEKSFSENNSGVLNENLRKIVDELDKKRDTRMSKVEQSINVIEKSISGIEQKNLELEKKMNQIDDSLTKIFNILKKN